MTELAKKFGKLFEAPLDLHGDAPKTLPKSIDALVVAPQGANQQRLAFALKRGARTRLVSDATGTEEALSKCMPDVVVADGSLCDKELLDLIARYGLSTRVIFVSDAVSRARVTKQLARGRRFTVVDREEVTSKLLPHAFKLVLPRSETRREASNLEVRFGLGNCEIRGNLVDISNKGCAISVRAFDGQAAVPGTPLDWLVVTKGENVIIDDVGGVVRSLVHRGDTGGFRVGVEFVPRPSRKGPQTRKLLTEAPIQVSAMFEALVGTENEICLTEFGNENEVMRAIVDEVDLDAKAVKLHKRTEEALDDGDVLQGTFEHDGMQHQFWTSVRDTDAAALVIGLPKTVVSTRHRGVQRFRPADDAPVRIAARSPISGKSLVTDALDLTASSVSFPISRQSDLFPIGTKVEGLRLTFANGESFRVDGRVRRLGADAGDVESPLYCAVEFVDDVGSDLGELAARITVSSLPDVSTDSGATCDQIWNFLEESGFLYPDKVARLDVAGVKRTMERLVGTPNEVAKTWLVRKDREIVAHLSSVRLFSSTWGLQHLAAISHKRSGSWASMLNLALAEYCEQHPKIEWLRVAYRPNNKWPHHVFGRFAHRVGDPARSDFRVHSYLVSPTNAGLRPESEARYEIRQFELSDLGALEACVVSNEQSILLPSADLSRNHINTGELTDSFDRLGLTRRREILVAERGGRPAGFALLEISSVGLNLSELTNATTIHCFEHDPELVRALGGAARQRYRDLGYENCIVLGDEQSTDDLAAIGFVKVKEYCQWIWHYTLLRSFYRYVSKNFP